MYWVLSIFQALGTGDRAGNKTDAISGFTEYIVSLVKESNNEYTYIKILSQLWKMLRKYLVCYMVFPVVMYGCESWTVKKAECQRTDSFELWCWRRLLRVPWTARRSNQSILKEISPGCSLEGMMLKLKLQYFGHLMRRADSLEKTLMLGGIGGQEEKGTTEDEMAGWHHLLDGHELEWTPGDSDGQGGLACCDSWGQKELDTTEQLNWTDAI